jgi:hypothetical protein
VITARKSSVTLVALVDRGFMLLFVSSKMAFLIESGVALGALKALLGTYQNRMVSAFVNKRFPGAYLCCGSEEAIARV